MTLFFILGKAGKGNKHLNGLGPTFIITHPFLISDSNDSKLGISRFRVGKNVFVKEKLSCSSFTYAIDNGGLDSNKISTLDHL